MEVVSVGLLVLLLFLGSLLELLEISGLIIRVNTMLVTRLVVLMISFHDNDGGGGGGDDDDGSDDDDDDDDDGDDDHDVYAQS